jgi:CRP-like cAMP-binding protein
VLYVQGDPALGLYVIQDGLVRLTAETEEGAAEELHRLFRGGVLGEAALLGDFRRGETAEILRDAVVLGLFRPDLRGLLRRERRVGLMVTVAVAQRVAAREEALLQVLREGHLPAHRLLHRLPLDQPADPAALMG